MFLVLWQVELSNLLLDVLIERRFPESLVSPHGMFLYACVGKLDDSRAQFLKQDVIMDVNIYHTCVSATSVSHYSTTRLIRPQNTHKNLAELSGGETIKGTV